jgi:CAAX protease family protein
MTSLPHSKDEAQASPAAADHREPSGIRAWVARRPLTAFLILILGLDWLILAIPILAGRHLIPGGGLPIEVFALAVTLLVMLPAALWVTAMTDGRAGVRALFARALRWRFGVGWWAVVLFGLPVLTVLLGLIFFGGSLHPGNLALTAVKQFGLIVIAVLVINLWEETVWAGFFQTRLEGRFNIVIAAAMTAVPFAGVHAPLLLIGDKISVLSVLKGIAGLLILGVLVRLMIGVVMRAAADSVLAVGVLHAVFDASNNDGGLVDSVLDGADPGNVTTITVVVLTAAVAGYLLWRRPGSLAKRVPVRREAQRPPNVTH